MSELSPLEARLSALLQQLAPQQRRKLAREVARGVRAIQARRIAAQRNPDGTPFAPPKHRLRKKGGRIRRTMFARLRTAKYLKMQTDPDSAVVIFADQVQRIARVHHFGLRDKVFRNRSLEADYPARELLGITPDDIALVQDAVLRHLAE